MALYLSRNFWVQPLALIPSANTLTVIKGFFTGKLRNVNIAISLTAALCFSYYLFLLLHNIGSIFIQWDPVMAWNNWAITWASGHFPLQTAHYPQLLPINWSIAYVLVGKTYHLQSFAKFIMPLFPISILLALADLAIVRRHFAYIIAIATTAILLITTAGNFLNSGYTEIPVASMAFITIYVLLLTGCKKIQDDKATFYKLLFISSIICAGCAVTKQAGVYIAIYFALFSYLFALLNFKATKKPTALLLSLQILLLLAIALPWYVYVEMNAKQLGNEIPFVMSGIYKEIFGEHVLKHHIANALIFPGLIFWFSMLAAVYFYIKEKSELVWRTIFISVVVPYTVIWMGFFYYDIRNLMLVLPLLGTVAGFGIYKACHSQKIFTFCKNQLLKTQPSYRLNLLSISIGIIIGCSIFYFTPKYLYNRQAKLQKQVGNKEFSAALYSLIKTQGLHGKIITSWSYLAYLPNMKKHFAMIDKNGHVIRPAFMNKKSFLKKLRKYPAQYILYSDYSGLDGKQFKKYLEKLVTQNKATPVIIVPGFTLYKILTPLL
ncbi:MAG: hypothetical protein JKY19_00120 [Alcanivoracaceae bacterium]|nr:hypothetical protein [Alcanivoracaceae bacterium]